MACNTPEIKDLRLLLLVFAILPLTTTKNVDCNGKAFHCVNSTHFRICVDFGRGLSSTVDDYVIPCPLYTECRVTNRFECEYPPAPSTTSTVPTTVQMADVTKTIQQTTTLKEFNNVEYKNTVNPHTGSDGTFRESSFIEESASTEPIVYEIPITKEPLEKVGEQNLKLSLNNINIENDSKLSTMSDVDLFVITNGDRPVTIISTTPDIITIDSVTQEYDTKILYDTTPYGTELTNVVSVQDSGDLKTQNDLFDDMLIERLSSTTIDPTTDASVYSGNLVSTPSSKLNPNIESQNNIQTNIKAVSTKTSSFVASTIEDNYDIFDNNSKNNATTKSTILISNDNFVGDNNDATTEYRTSILDSEDVSQMLFSNLPSTDSTFVDNLDSSTLLSNDLEGVYTTELVTTQDIKMSKQDLKTTEDIVITPIIYLDHSSNSLPGRSELPISDINIPKNNHDDRRSYHVFLPMVTNESETDTDFYDQVEFDMTSYDISSSRALENLTLAQTVQFTPKLQANGADVIENQTNIDKKYTSAIVPELRNSSSFDDNVNTPSLNTTPWIKQTVNEKSTKKLTLELDNISKVYSFSTQSKTNFIPTSSIAPETTIQEFTTDSLLPKIELTSNTEPIESTIIFEKESYSEMKYNNILNSTLPALLVSTATAQTKLQDIVHDYTYSFDSVSSKNNSLYDDTTTTTISNVEKHVDKNYTKDTMQNNSHTSSDLENILITTTLASNSHAKINHVSHIVGPVYKDQRIMDSDHNNVEYDEKNIYKEVLSVQSEKPNIQSYDQNNVSDNFLRNTIVPRDDFTTVDQTTTESVEIYYSNYDDMDLLAHYEKTTLKTIKDNINIAETLNHEIITTTQSGKKKDIGASENDSATNIENILTSTSAIEYDTTTAQITEDERNVVVIYDGTVLLDENESNTLRTIKNDVGVPETLNNEMVMTTQTDVDKDISTGSMKYVYITKLQSEQNTDLDLQNLLATTTATSIPRIQNRISGVSIPVATDESLIDYNRNIKNDKKHFNKQTLTVYSEKANSQTNNDNNVPGNGIYTTPAIKTDLTTTQISIESTINDYSHYYDVTSAEKYESTTLMSTKNDNDVFESLNYETTQSDLEKPEGTSTTEYSYNTRVQNVHNTGFDLENVLNTTMASNESDQINLVSNIVDAANKDKSTINFPNLEYNKDLIHKKISKISSKKGDTKFYDVNKMSGILLPFEDSTISAQIITEGTINYYDSDLTAVYEATTSTTINNYDLMTSNYEMVMTTPSNEDKYMGTNPVEYLHSTKLQTGQNIAFEIENVLNTTPVYDSSVYDLGVQEDLVTDIQASSQTDENTFEHDSSLVYDENYIHKETLAIQSDEASSRSKDENKVLYNILNDKLLATEDSTIVKTTTEGTMNDYYKYYYTDLPANYEKTTVRTKDDKPIYETTNHHDMAIITEIKLDKKIGTILNNELVMSTQSNAQTEFGIPWNYLRSPKIEIEENTDVELENIKVSTLKTADSDVQIKQLVPIDIYNNSVNYRIQSNHSVGYDRTYTHKEAHIIVSKEADNKSFDENNKVLDNITPKTIFVETTNDYSKRYHTEKPANYESTNLTTNNNALLDLPNNETTMTNQSIIGKDVDTRPTKYQHSEIKNEHNTTLGFESIIISTPDSNDLSVQIEEVHITNPTMTIESSTEYNSRFGNIETNHQEENHVKVDTKIYNESLFNNILDKPFLSKEDSAIEVQSATRRTINNEPISSTTNNINTNIDMTDFRALHDEMARTTQPNTYISDNTSSTHKIFESKSSTLQSHISDIQTVDYKDSTFLSMGDYQNDPVINEGKATTGDINLNKIILETNPQRNENDDLILGINDNKYTSENIFHDKLDSNIGYGEISNTIKTLTVSEMVLGTSLNKALTDLTNKKNIVKSNNENQHHHSLPNIENFNYNINAMYDTSKEDTTRLLTKPKTKLANHVNSSQTKQADSNQASKNSSRAQNNHSNSNNDQNIKQDFDCLHRYRGRYADSEDCRKFYICIGKSYSINGMCPINSVFSEFRKQCTRNLSHCVRNYTFYCTAEGRFSDIFHNNIYYICVKNSDHKFIRYKLQCENGYHLNKDRVHCVPNIIKSLSRIDSDDSHRSSDTSETDSSESRKEYNRVHDFNCEKDGKFPDRNNCRKYYVCYKNKLTFRRKLKSCDSDEVFDKDKEKCIDAESNEC